MDGTSREASQSSYFHFSDDIRGQGTHSHSCLSLVHSIADQQGTLRVLRSTKLSNYRRGGGNKKGVGES